MVAWTLGDIAGPCGGLVGQSPRGWIGTQYNGGFAACFESLSLYGLMLNL